jgi:hypothetical protein
LRRLVAIAPLVVLVAGCGGGGLSRAEYAARADAICAKYKRKLDALPKPASPADVATFAASALPLVRAEARELRTLRPPKEERDLAARWQRSNDEVVRAVDGLREAAASEDANRITAALATAQTVGGRSTTLSRALGMKACAA